MKRIFFLFLPLIVGVSGLSAQTAIPRIEIDNMKLGRDITADVEKSLAGNADWSLSQLLGRCTQEVPAHVTAAIGQLPANTCPLSSEETYSKCGGAILMFGRFYDCGNCDQMHAAVTATATVLSPDGICLTNYHVMEGIIRNNSAALKGDSLYFAAAWDGRCYPVTHVLGYCEESDSAIFQVDTRGDQLPYIPLGRPALTGSEVRLIAHPRGTFYYYSEGVVARNTAEQNREGKEIKRMQVSADFAAGSSGGGILDKCGNLVGMVESTNSVYYNPEKNANLQMVFKNTIPVSEIRALLGL